MRPTRWTSWLGQWSPESSPATSYCGGAARPTRRRRTRGRGGDGDVQEERVLTLDACEATARTEVERNGGAELVGARRWSERKRHRRRRFEASPRRFLLRRGRGRRGGPFAPNGGARRRASNGGERRSAMARVSGLAARKRRERRRAARSRVSQEVHGRPWPLLRREEEHSRGPWHRAGGIAAPGGGEERDDGNFAKTPWPLFLLYFLHFCLCKMMFSTHQINSNFVQTLWKILIWHR